MNTYFFNVYTYTNDFDFVVKTKQLIKIKRTHYLTASDYLKTKYKRKDGFFVELISSYKN